MTNWIPLTGPGSRLPTREDADERARQRGEYRYRPYGRRTVGALPVPQLTEADVRRIVREELEKGK